MPSRLALAAVLAAAVACSPPPPVVVARPDPTPPPSAEAPATGLQPALALDQAPGNFTITPQGRRIASLHQFFTPQRTVVELDADGRLYHFPPSGEGALPQGLAGVLGIRSDTAGVVYILDNGAQGQAPAKLVLWDTRIERHVRTIPLADATADNSFPNDLVFDYRRGQVYISDPAGGANAAILVVDLASGRARRVLVGHESVVPEDVTLQVEGEPLRIRQPDGTIVTPRIGVDGIAIDHANEWVYYGALHGRTLWRVRAADLADASLAAPALATRVERYATKPISDGMVMDAAGNIYLGDLEHNAFGVVTPDRTYRELARRADLRWVDDFAFGPDGYLYVVTNQLHRSPVLNAGVRDVTLPFRIFRIRPLAPGRPGY